VHTVSSPPRAARLGSAILLLGVATALVGAMLLPLAPLGTRPEIWTFRTGFVLLRWSAYLAIGAAVLLVVGGLLTRRWLVAIPALVVAIAVFLVPYRLLQAARLLPAIHDITTDTLVPPPFEAVLPLRAGAPNPPDYDPGVAPLQRQAYPDLHPLTLDLPPSLAFALALETARGRGWDIVASDADAGRIEATDTTFWFRFKDDIVIRLAALPDGGTRIDVRSKSRVGRSDVGKNAARIRQFLGALRHRAGSVP
jgi:hypothetical protein